jgi:zinc transport system ATP-binding protein
MLAANVDHLTFSYPLAYKSEPVLQNASTTIAQNEFVGIIGPNGGGKTTFLKLLMGILKPSSGKITLLGKSPSESKKEIAYVPQVFRVDRQFPLTVLELVLGGCFSKKLWWQSFDKEDREKALLALEKVGLLSFAKASFGSLSGGQAQRALIARALVSSPKILILDEPTANVDKQAEKEICTLLHELKNKCTIIMVTHDLKTVLTLIDYVLYIQRDITKIYKPQLCEHFTLGLYHSPYLSS